MKTHLYLEGYSYRPHENGPLRKYSLIWRNIKTLSLRTEVDENIFKTELFKDDGVTIITWFHCSSFPQTQSNMADDCSVFKFLRGSVGGGGI